MHVGAHSNDDKLERLGQVDGPAQRASEFGSSANCPSIDPPSRLTNDITGPLAAVYAWASAAISASIGDGDKAGNCVIRPMWGDGPYVAIPALVTAPATPSHAPRFNANPSTRSGLVGFGISTPSSR